MLRALLLLVSLLAAAPALAQEPGDLPDLRAVALEAINADRTAEGLPALESSGTLDAIAQAHARDMLERGYFAHESPGGEGVRDRYLAAGGSDGLVVGENLARCDGCPAPDAARVRDLQRGWMNSPGHRENILTEGFGRFGFGIATEGGAQYAVQTFAGAGSDSGEPVTADTLAATLAGILDARGLPVEASAPLADAVAGKVALDERPDLAAITRPLSARSWRGYTLLAASCGGCGTAVTEADLRRFVDGWAKDGRLPRGATHVGAIGLADGEGRKRLVALFGTAR